jgi:hypothetical protein
LSCGDDNFFQGLVIAFDAQVKPPVRGQPVPELVNFFKFYAGVDVEHRDGHFPAAQVPEEMQGGGGVLAAGPGQGKAAGKALQGLLQHLLTFLHLIFQGPQVHDNLLQAAWNLFYHRQNFPQA